MKEKQSCPNCGAEIKNGTFSSNPELYPYQIEFINFFLNKDFPTYCKKCGGQLYLDAKAKKRQRVSESSAYIEQHINDIPILTIQSPINWNYMPIEMVTSQSVMGTGVLSEISSSWADFFGNPSNAYNSKLRAGETLCKNQLRSECIRLGGHAIIAVDIDYSEAGSTKNMLMVCISGTAIRLNNPEIVSKDFSNIVDRLILESQDLRKYQELQDKQEAYT